MDQFKNFAGTRLAVGINAVVTSIQVQEGSKLPPITGANQEYNLTIWPFGVQPTEENSEIVRVTARSVNVLTVLRAQEGSSAKEHEADFNIALTLTKKTITDIYAAITAITAGGASGSFTSQDGKTITVTNGIITGITG